jgi:hypothetical protein
MEPSQSSPVRPSLPEADPRAQRTLEQSLVVLAPLVRWLLRSGVQYGSLAQALKGVFLDEARAELERTGTRPTDSALSVLSGVHRKDVRTLSGQPGANRPIHAPTPASMVFTRWITDPIYRGVDPQDPQRTCPLRRIARLGPAPSFEALARSVSSDVHPRTLLDELQRLGFARLEGDDILLDADRFISPPGDADAARTLAVNTADHLCAAVHNLAAPADQRLLEQSIFADGLSTESAAFLSVRAREIWAGAFDAMVSAATARVNLDQPRDDTPMRMRFGVYYFHESVETDAPDPTESARPAQDRSRS